MNLSYKALNNHKTNCLYLSISYKSKNAIIPETTDPALKVCPKLGLSACG